MGGAPLCVRVCGTLFPTCARVCACVWHPTFSPLTNHTPVGPWPMNPPHPPEQPHPPPAPSGTHFTPHYTHPKSRSGHSTTPNPSTPTRPQVGVYKKVAMRFAAVWHRSLHAAFRAWHSEVVDRRVKVNRALDHCR
jgi:hypothetical protein